LVTAASLFFPWKCFPRKIELDETEYYLSKQVIDEESIEGVYAFSKLIETRSSLKAVGHSRAQLVVLSFTKTFRRQTPEMACYMFASELTYDTTNAGDTCNKAFLEIQRNKIPCLKLLNRDVDRLSVPCGL